MKPWTQVPPQLGRRFIITGANSGIGFETARILGSRGASIVMACRSVERGQAAAEQVPGYDKGRIVVRRLDVADLDSVVAFADDIAAAGESYDVLINNAGILGVPYGVTADGAETHFATNHLGHFALTNLLLPLLEDRVVVVGSRNHRGGQLDLDDLAWERRPYGRFPAYNASKLANLLFLAELDRRLRAVGSPLRAVGAHPGSTYTHITSGTGNRLLTAIGQWGQRMTGMPTWRGALPTVYAATMDVPGNTYIGPHGRLEMHGWPAVARRSKMAQDPELARKLWARSEELTRVTFPLG